MRKEGTIVRWNNAKGFGFIRTEAVAQDVFVHARDWRPRAGEVPHEGLHVTFEDIHVGGKGPRAVAVRPAARPFDGAVNEKASRARSSSRKRRPGRALYASQAGAAWALPLVVAYGSGLGWLVLQRQLPWWVIPASILLNLATFFAYWRDKYAARKARWRIEEDTLHLWSLAGGWGGAWFAQQVLRHKSAKASFRAAYWATVAMHCSALLGFWWFLRRA